MNHPDWITEYRAQLESQQVDTHIDKPSPLEPVRVLRVDSKDWGKSAAIAKAMQLRWAGIWGDQQGDELVLSALLAHAGRYALLRTRLPMEEAEIASHTPSYPVASRMERHLRDLLGLVFTDHPDNRRWTRHKAWSSDQFPLRRDFPVEGDISGRKTPGDSDYPFEGIQGSGVYEIPVGPVHAGIIEPGHFRFQVAGEPILRLEQHLGYVHKGIEKIAVGRDARALARLAARVSGDSAVAHAWAACQAMERAAAIDPPPGASIIRGLLSERERVVNHLGDIGAICNDVGFAFAQMQCQVLRERWLRRNHELFGHRLLMDCIVPGGVSVDLDDSIIHQLRQDHAELHKLVRPLFDIINDNPSLEDRLLTTGYLSPVSARELGCSGYVGKASGQAIDLRQNALYEPYNRLSYNTITRNEGDVAARVQLRQDELLASLDLMNEMLDMFEAADKPVILQQNLPEIPGAEGIGMIDGWRGETIAFVRFDEQSRIARYFPRDPSWFTWPALERIVLDNIVPDFPVCNKSVNGSYSGQDL